MILCFSFAILFIFNFTNSYLSCEIQAFDATPSIRNYTTLDSAFDSEFLNPSFPYPTTKSLLILIKSTCIDVYISGMREINYRELIIQYNNKLIKFENC